jgi:hypothetical protein
MFVTNSMITTFPLHLTFLDLIKLKLCGKGSKCSLYQLLICVQSALIRAQKNSNKFLFIHKFITKLVKLLAKNDYDKVEEQIPK